MGAKNENKWNKNALYLGSSFCCSRRENLTRGTKASSLKINQEKNWDFTVSFEHETFLVTQEFGPCIGKLFIGLFSLPHKKFVDLTSVCIKREMCIKTKIKQLFP